MQIMKKCLTNIIECLRNDKLHPYAYASRFEPGFYPENAIYIDTITYYAAGIADTEIWWEVDFNAYVNITQYQVVARNEPSWIYNWRTDVSHDRIVWSFLDKHENQPCGHFPHFNVHSEFLVRYFRVTCTGNAYQVNFPHIVMNYFAFFGSYMQLTNIDLKGKCQTLFRKKFNIYSISHLLYSAIMIFIIKE